jgi:hypothetical protein
MKTKCQHENYEIIKKYYDSSAMGICSPTDCLSQYSLSVYEKRKCAKCHKKIDECIFSDYYLPRREDDYKQKLKELHADGYVFGNFHEKPKEIKPRKLSQRSAIKLFKEMLEIRLKADDYGVRWQTKCDDESSFIIHKLEKNGYGIEFAYSEEDYKKAGCIYALVPYEYFDSNSELSKKPVKEIALATEENWGYDLTGDPERD